MVAVLPLAVQLIIGHTGLSSGFFHARLVDWQYRCARRVAASGGIDTVAIGNSQVPAAFNAGLYSRLTGRESVNLGLIGTDAYVQAYWLRNVVDPTFRPKHVIWAMSPRDLNANPKFFDRNQHTRILGSPCFRVAGWPGGWRLIPHVMDLLPFHRRPMEEWFNLAVNGLPFNPMDDRGWRLHRGVYKAPAFKQYTSGFHFEATYSREWEDYIEESVRGLKERGVRVSIVLLPIHRNAIGHYDPARHEEGLRRIESMARRTGSEFHNWLQDDRFSAPELYEDQFHLNMTGATEFTRILAETK